MADIAISFVRRFFCLVVVLLMYQAPLAAATFTVNSTLDAVDAVRGDGVCETAPGNGVCTLRAAVQETNTLPGADIILLPAGTYVVSIRTGGTGDAVGSLDLRDHVSIVGAGADATIVDGGAIDSVFASTGSLRTINISDVTIQNGSVSAFGVGGGIVATGNNNVTLTRVVVQNNHAGDGGGIFNRGTLTLVGSVVRNNTAVRTTPESAQFRQGGGIYNAGGSLTLRQSVIRDNTAISAGGLFNRGTATIETSTISGNTATNNVLNGGDGGGAVVNGDGVPGILTVTNTTISGNRAHGHHGGIYNVNGTVTLNSATVTDNAADADNDGVGNSGGFTLGAGASATVRNSIIAGNRAAGTAHDCLSPVAGALGSGGYNLIGSLGAQPDCAIAPVAGDQFGATAPIDPKLKPLADYGGPTMTHALEDASPALDAADPAGCTDGTVGLSTDQRGAPRIGGARCDIGAYELNPPIANAGADQRVNWAAVVALDGTTSSAWAGIASYLWTQTAGTPVVLVAANSATPSFSAPSVGGVLTFQLRVTDRYGIGATDSVTVTVNDPPSADAGADQTIVAGAAVGLNGSASRDADGAIVSYAWIQAGGTPVMLANADSATPSFTAPSAAGTLTFQLTVTDNDGATHTDSVAVTVTVPPPPTSGNKSPVANAGSDETVYPRSLVFLNGHRSYDPDGRIVSYRWVQTAGAPVALYGASWPWAMFVAPKNGGVLTFTLTVTDNKGASGSDNVTVTVEDCVRRWYDRFFDHDDDRDHGHQKGGCRR